MYITEKSASHNHATFVDFTCT